MRLARSGTAKRSDGGATGLPKAKLRDHGSAASCTAATCITRQASSAVAAKIETQSSDWQAGTTPRTDSAPREGFSPTMLLSAAGTRPEPAVSVPSAKVTRPARHRDARAGRRAAGHQRRVAGVARHRIGRAHADQPGGELVEVGLADEDGAGIDEALDDGGVLLGDIGVVGTGGGRLHGEDVDVVLDREGDAPERHGDRIEGRQGRRDGRRLVLGDHGDEDAGVGRGGNAAVDLGDDIRRGQTACIRFVQPGDVEVDTGHFFPPFRLFVYKAGS